MAVDVRLGRKWAGGSTRSMAANLKFGEGGKCGGKGLMSTAMNMNFGEGGKWGRRDEFPH